MPWKRLPRTGLLILSFVLPTVLLLWWASASPQGVLTWLSASIWASGALAALFSWLPFAMAEWALYVSIVWGVFTLSRAVYRLFRQKTAFFLARWLARLALIGSCAVFVFFALWGVAYYAPPLGERLDIPEAEHTTDALYETTVWLRDEMNRLAYLVPRNADSIMTAGGYSSLIGSAGAGYTALRESMTTRPAFPENPLPPKSMTFSSLMSRTGIAGIYIPFTGEPIVNADGVDAHLPYTICHELAHRSGFGPEDEANFVAFLACAANPDPNYAYSGYHLAYIYCYEALSEQDPARASEVNAGVCREVFADFAAQTAYIEKWQGPAWDLGEAVNDTYLKTMQQPEGRKTYGLVVDLLIDWHADQIP